MNNLEKFKFEEDDFKLTQSNIKIKDNALDTPPTTYLKDAFKRFCKNRSSVVAAVIISALLLMSFFFPLVSPHDTNEHKEQTLLPSKLFNSGFGFWDGTTKITNSLYDVETQSVVASYDMDCIVDGSLTLSKEGDYFVNSAIAAAYGGIISLENRSTNENVYQYLQNGVTFDFTKNDDVIFNIDFSDESNSSYGVKGYYRIKLVYFTDAELTNEVEVVLQSETNSHADLSFNLSNLLDTDAFGAKVVIELKSSSTDTYMFMDSINFTTTSLNQELIDVLEAQSITDANATALATSGSPNIWDSTGNFNVYKANVIYASFRYDNYEAKLGETSLKIDEITMNKYIENGWCEYDFTVGVSSFKVLNEAKCPILSIENQTSFMFNGVEIFELETTQLMYKVLGYETMPKYLFGTDSVGRDIVTIVFDGLKVSLLLAFVVSAICFAIGIIWGAVSGYFGGNIDLAMERIMEILGGVPSLVVLTLVIILVGNNFFTFALALCLTGWMGVASRTRVQFYRFKGREYVLASRTLGASDKRLIFKHILPNAMGTIITGSILMIPGVIGSETTLAYLGLGLEGQTTLGIILSGNQSYINTFPMLILFPAFILSLIMISFNLFGNGLRDALNPTLKGSE